MKPNISRKLVRSAVIAGAAPVLLAFSASAALVSQYDFEEGSGTVASQSVGGAVPDGTINGATWTTGIAPDSTSALNFTSGTNVQVGTSSIWQNLSGFSVSAWIQPTGFAGSGNTASPVIWIGTTGGSARFTVQMNDFGDLRVGGRRVGNEGNFNGSLVVGTNVSGTTNGSDGDPLQLGQTYHVAATADYSTGLLSLYLNGTLLASNTISSWGTGLTANETYIMRIGSNAAGNEQFIGVIDDVSTYDTALSASEIAALAVPEPSFALLGGLGLAGLALGSRRRI